MARSTPCGQTDMARSTRLVIRQTDMARSTRLVMLDEKYIYFMVSETLPSGNIYTLWGRKRFLLFYSTSIRVYYDDLFQALYIMISSFLNY